MRGWIVCGLLAVVVGCGGGNGDADVDVVVALALARQLEGILAANGVPHELRVYPGHAHEPMALDAVMFERVRAWYQAHGVL